MIKPVPLEERTCIQLWVAGILSPNGDKPRCIGAGCSGFESCKYQILHCLHELDDLKHSPRADRLKQGKGWGE